MQAAAPFAPEYARGVAEDEARVKRRPSARGRRSGAVFRKNNWVKALFILALFLFFPYKGI